MKFLSQLELEVAGYLWFQWYGQTNFGRNKLKQLERFCCSCLCSLFQVEDFEAVDGKISLIREEATVSQRTETGVLSSFYNYFSLTEPAQQRGPSAEEQEAIKQAHRCIQECHVEQLITESKFLRGDSLQELIKVRSLKKSLFGPRV